MQVEGPTVLRTPVWCGRAGPCVGASLPLLVDSASDKRRGACVHPTPGKAETDIFERHGSRPDEIVIFVALDEEEEEEGECEDE